MKSLKFRPWVICAVFAAVAASSYAQELKLEKSVFSPGEQIKVSFTAPDSYPPDAWVGIVPSDVKHHDPVLNDSRQMAFQHLERKTSGVLVFTAPDKPGSYDFRMSDQDTLSAHETASITFTVQ